MGFFDRVKHHFVPSHENAYRPHLLRKGALTFLLAVALLSEGALVFNLMAQQSGSNFLAAVIQSEILSLTNTERVDNNVSPLTENKLLDQSAQAKADDMAARGYFAHNSPDGKDPWSWIDAAGYNYQYAGENLAVRFVDSKDVVDAWMASPTHRANIVKPVYTEVGVGIAQGIYKGQEATFVVQHFGTPAVAAAPTPVSEAPAPASSPEPQPAASRVLGAETVTPPPSSITNTVVRQSTRVLSEPRATTGWILGIIAAVLMLALAFTFVHHIQIQSRDLLLPGTMVAAIALALIFLNNTFLSSALSGATQSAGVAEYKSGVVLTDVAAQQER